MEFWKGVFSDNGNPSFSRIGAGFALAFSCGWVTSIVLKTKALPDLTGISLFIGTLYGVNSIRNILQKPPQQ